MLGGDQGRERLEGILALPNQTVGGEPAYPGLFVKAAVLVRSIVANHPFVDGNKRMGIASAMLFLSLNDEAMLASNDEVVDFTLRIAAGQERDLAAIAAWLERHSLPLDDVFHAYEEGELDALVRTLPGDDSVEDRPLLRWLVLGI